jgi:hypothetical protein
MDTMTLLLIGLGILALVVIAFFAVFRGKGKVQLDTKFGKLKAEGENPPPPKAVPAGVNAEDVNTGGSLIAHSSSEGGVHAKGAKAKGDIRATHLPGEPPPKT